VCVKFLLPAKPPTGAFGLLNVRSSTWTTLPKGSVGPCAVLTCPLAGVAGAVAVSTFLFHWRNEMPFSRRLSEPFVTKLNELYESTNAKDGWWRALVDHKEVFIAVRNDKINAYAGGASIARIVWSQGEIRFEVHIEYLVFAKRERRNLYVDLLQTEDPSEAIVVNSTEDYVNWLNRIIKKSTMLSGDERRGENLIAIEHPCVLDIEAAFTTTREEESDSNGSKASVGRVDLVVINNGTLSFFEAKLLSNGETRCRPPAKPAVCEQLCEYHAWLKQDHAEVLAAYQKLVRDTKQLKGDRFRRLEKIGEPTSLDPIPRLIVFGFRQTDMPNIKAMEQAVLYGVDDRIPGFDAKHIICVGDAGNVTDRHLGS